MANGAAWPAAQLTESEPARRPALHQSPGLWPARSLRCAGKAKRTTRAWDTKIKTRKTADERRAEADAPHESIGSQLEELTSTEGWARFLAVATGFHSCSLSNVLLILSQRPEASRVAASSAYDLVVVTTRIGSENSGVKSTLQLSGGVIVTFATSLEVIAPPSV